MKLPKRFQEYRRDDRRNRSEPYDPEWDWRRAPEPSEMAVAPVAVPVTTRCPQSVWGWHVEHPSYKGTCGYCGVDLLPF